MEVHLIRSEGFTSEDHQNVVALLQSYPGVIQFIPTDFVWDFEEGSYEIREFDKDEFEKRQVLYQEVRMPMREAKFPLERPVVKWHSIWKACDAYRKYADLKADTYVHIFTEMYNEANWFSAVSEDGRSGFSHTADWDYFIGSDSRFPIAFVTAEEILSKHMFSSMTEVMEHVHHDARGCINDLCENKKDIHLKLRTADICDDCLQLIREKQVDTRLFSQVMEIIEGIREQMLFKSRYKINEVPSRLLISGFTMDISLPDMGKQIVPLSPKEKAVYLLYLKHDEPFNDTDFPDKSEMLSRLYKRVTDRGDLAAIENVINKLLDPVDNDLQQVRSKIGNKFAAIVGEEMSQHYKISGERGGPKGICLDRDLVEWEAAI